MTFFDRIRNDHSVPMTPQLAFAVSLTYGLKADGKLDEDEIGHLLWVLGGGGGDSTAGHHALLDQAMQIARVKPVGQFLVEVSPMLTEAQKLCILVNLIECGMANGDDGDEQTLAVQFQRAFGIADERVASFHGLLTVKNDHSVFMTPSPREWGGITQSFGSAPARAS